MLCALRTVLRLGELVALQWGDIDWNGRFIEVQRNLVQGRADLAEVPQAAQARPSTQLQDALVGWRRALQARWLKKGERCRCGCFPRSGTALGEPNVRTVFTRLLEKAVSRTGILLVLGLSLI